MPAVTDYAGIENIDVTKEELAHFMRASWIKAKDNTRYGGKVDLQLHDMIAPRTIEAKINDIRNNGFEVTNLADSIKISATMEEISVLHTKGLIQWCFTTYIYTDYSAVMDALNDLRGTVKMCA